MIWRHAAAAVGIVLVGIVVVVVLMCLGAMDCGTP